MAKLTSFLSTYVHYIVCELVDADQGLALEDSKELDQEEVWKNLQDALQNNMLESKEDYVTAVKAILPIARNIESYYVHRAKDLAEVYENLQKWLLPYNSFSLDELSLTSESTGTDTILLLLRLTSTIERALGDIYVLSGKTCPFLLRDLLATEELRVMFGGTKMKLLRILMGSPLGLNLRNLSWHGFLSPSEIPKVFFLLLLFTSDGIASDVWKKFGENGVSRRPVITKSTALDLLENLFQSFSFDINCEDVLECFSKSSTSHLAVQYLQMALSYYSQERYADCVITVLPCLENILRHVFATCNNCEHRVMTAESSVLYTTLDEVLSQYLEDGTENKIRLVLGDGTIMLLLDIFSMPDGPRVRDRLSHGEMALELLSRPVACLLLCLTFHVSATSQTNGPRPDKPGDTIRFEAKREPGEDAFGMRDILKIIGTRLCDYESLFHPIAITQRACQMCRDNLQQFDTIPSPEEFRISAPDEAVCAEAETRESAGMGGDHRKGTRKAVLLFRSDKTEMEIITALRHIAEECYTASTNVAGFLHDRWQSYTERNLRSRQRTNYGRLIARLPEIRSLIEGIVKIVSRYLMLVDDEGDQIRIRDHGLRRLKSVLKVAENLRAMTLQNKWDEVCALSLEAEMR